MTTTSQMRAPDALRAALKAAGFNTRRVSVKENHCTLVVTIRDNSVSLAQVEAIAGRFEVVQRCEATGDILDGGNRFVRVAYADVLVAPLAAMILALLEVAGRGEFVTLPGGFRALKVSPHQGAAHLDEWRLEGPTFDWRNDRAYGVGWAAKRLAIASLDASAAAAASAVVASPSA